MNKFIYTRFPRSYGKFLYLKAKVFILPKMILLKLGILNFFGAKEQDKWVVSEIFNNKKKGYFLDLAATNGLLENNTYVLESFFNWDGIAIEGNSKFFTYLKKNRKCTCINEVVSGSVKNIEFLEDGPTGGIIGENFDNNLVKRFQYIEKSKNKIISKKTKKLEDILIQANAPKIIDYFSLAAEGSETDIMENFSYDKYIFLSLTVQRPTAELNKKLFENGYVFIKNNKTIAFFVHKTIDNFDKIKKDKFVQLPRKSW
jgi:hypothetical protein